MSDNGDSRWGWLDDPPELTLTFVRNPRISSLEEVMECLYDHGESRPLFQKAKRMKFDETFNSHEASDPFRISGMEIAPGTYVLLENNGYFACQGKNLKLLSKPKDSGNNTEQEFNEDLEVNDALNVPVDKIPAHEFQSAEKSVYESSVPFACSVYWNSAIWIFTFGLAIEGKLVFADEVYEKNSLPQMLLPVQDFDEELNEPHKSLIILWERVTGCKVDPAWFEAEHAFAEWRSPPKTDGPRMKLPVLQQKLNPQKTEDTEDSRSLTKEIDSSSKAEAVALEPAVSSLTTGASNDQTGDILKPNCGLHVSNGPCDDGIADSTEPALPVIGAVDLSPKDATVDGALPVDAVNAIAQVSLQSLSLKDVPSGSVLTVSEEECKGTNSNGLESAPSCTAGMPSAHDPGEFPTHNGNELLGGRNPCTGDVCTQNIPNSGSRTTANFSDDGLHLNRSPVTAETKSGWYPVPFLDASSAERKISGVSGSKDSKLFSSTSTGQGAVSGPPSHETTGGESGKGNAMGNGPVLVDSEKIKQAKSRGTDSKKQHRTKPAHHAHGKSTSKPKPAAKKKDKKAKKDRTESGTGEAKKGSSDSSSVSLGNDSDSDDPVEAQATKLSSPVVVSPVPKGSGKRIPSDFAF